MIKDWWRVDYSDLAQELSDDQDLLHHIGLAQLHENEDGSKKLGTSGFREF